MKKILIYIALVVMMYATLSSENVAAATLNTGDIVKIIPVCAPGMPLDVEYVGTDDKTSIIIYYDNYDSNAQLFTINNNSDGTVTFFTHCGKTIDLASAKAKNKQTIWQYSSNLTLAQRWYIVPTNVESDTYYIKSSVNTDYVFDIAGGSNTAFTKLNCYKINYSAAQRFYIKVITPAKKSVEDINNNATVSYQSCRCTSSGAHSTGICNVNSITTLLNRKSYCDTGNGNAFSVEDSLVSNGCYNIKAVQCNTGYHSSRSSYCYSGDTGSWAYKTYTSGADSSIKYSAIRISSSTVSNTLSSKGISFETYLTQLLDEHPEGIALRSKTANHVVVVTNYTLSNGNTTFYVFDPVSGYSTLEASYIYRANGYKSLYSGLNFIVYLQ